MSKDIYKEQFDLWYDFKDQITYVNRFFQQHEVLKRISSIIGSNNLKLPQGTILYRARNYNGDTKFIRDFEQLIQSKDKVYEQPPTESQKQEKDLAIKELYMAYRESVNRRALEERAKSGFWGYAQEESFVPQDNEKIREGRANPAKIKYLYVADSPNTALAEVRPLLENYISVAEIKLENDLLIADLTYDIFGKIQKTDEMLVYLIMEEYSKPNNNQPFDYLPTQYISEYIKCLGFDGIKYNSSLYGRGRNYVIFNYDKCEAISSKLYQLNDICYDAKCVGPIGGLSGQNDLYHWKLEPYKREQRDKFILMLEELKLSKNKNKE